MPWLVPKPPRAKPQASRTSTRLLPMFPIAETFATCAVAFLAFKPARGMKLKAVVHAGCLG